MLQRRARSLNWQLTLLALGLLVPTLLFVGVLLWRFAEAERGVVEEEARGLSRGFAVAVDREIYGVLTTLQALATSPSLPIQDFASLYAQASEVSRLQNINISLRDLNGRAIFTTRAPFGTDVGVPSLLAQTDREVGQTGRTVVSDLFTSTVLGRPVFQIVTPVRIGPSIGYVIGASIEVSYLADAIRREHLPSGWIGSIIDGNGIIVSRTERHDEMTGRPASADYRAQVQKAREGLFYGTNGEGRHVLVGYARSELSGWTTRASMTSEAVNAPLRRSLLALVGIGLGFAVLATAGSLVAGRRLGSSFDQLTRAAIDIGAGRPVGPVTTSVVEINAVGQVLARAAALLGERAEERDRAETALRELNEHLEAEVTHRTRERNRLWETTNDLVGTGTSAGLLTAVNPAWSKLLGWSGDALLSRPFAEFVDPTDRETLGEAVAKLSAGEPLTGYINRMIAKDGHRRTIMWSAVPVPGQDAFDMVGRDLTAQQLAEDALRQSQKMEAVGQLTGGIAHDFNNMLAVIIGSLDMMERRLARGEGALDRFVVSARDAAKRAAALTHRLLAFSRQQPLAPEPIDANRMVAGMTDLLVRALGEQNRIETVLSAGLWRAKADPNQLESVILNLAVNARDAMPGGGKLTIETANAHVDDAYGRENEIGSGQYVLIAVTDTGTGMKPEVVARAFEPFFTTKPVGQGTGLGLSQVFGFARQSGGHVKIYSEPGFGSTIKLYLPRYYGEEATPSPVIGEIRTKFANPHERILIVEDEERVRSYALEALLELGYKVASACDAQEALRLLQDGSEVDLLFTDIVMPGMTGRQLVDEAVLLRPNLKVLYTTGYSRNAIVHNGVLDPGVSLLAKPFSVDQLAAAVRQVLDA